MKINNCRAARAQLPLFIGGELELADAQQMSEHLAQCARCASEAARLEATTEAIDAALRTDARAPVTLDARVMATIRRLPARRLSWPAFAPPWARARQVRLAIGVASALLAGFVGGHFLWRAPQPQTFRPLPALPAALSAALPSDELAQSYRLMKNGVMTRGTTEAQVAQQLRALAPAGADPNIELVALHNPEVTLIGGCWMSIGGHFVPSFCYDWQGKRVSIFQVPCAQEQAGMLSQQRDEVSTVTWKHDGKLLALVTEAAPEQSLKLARQVEAI